MLPYLGCRPLLKQHFSALVEQEDAERAVQSDAVALDPVAVLLARCSDCLVTRVHQNAVLAEEIEWQRFVVLFHGLRELLRDTQTLLVVFRYQAQARR